MPKSDSLRFGRVGLIAIGGFLIGIVWPRLAGLELVPAAPGRHRTNVALSASASASTPPSVASQLPRVEKKKPPPSEEEKLQDRIKVLTAETTSCRNSDGRPQENCSVDLDSVARARLLALVDCEAAKGRKGILSIGFEVDFEANKFERFILGKSTTLPSDVAKAIVACAEVEFERATVAGVEHEEAGYTVFYKVEFLPDPAPEDSAEGGEVVEASGRATVNWHTALIRKTPRDGEVVARILSGTEVVITGRAADWYRVKYRGKEGWVFRSAIGL